jgi:uncharacterized Tic20 family protein
MTEYPPSGPAGDPNVPPSAPQYGQQPPQYGQEQPQYGTPPQYGAPQYGAPQQYGQQPPQQYGQQPPQYGAPQYGAPAGMAGVSDADRKLWAMLAHLGGIILGFIAPLIVWAIYKDRDEFLKDQSTEALNFQITVLIGFVVSGVLSAVFIGILTGFAVWVASIVFSIIGGMAANRGERYRYPFALRLVK